MESFAGFSSLCPTICSTDRSAITLGKLFLLLLKHQILAKEKILKLCVCKRRINRTFKTSLNLKLNWT